MGRKTKRFTLALLMISILTILSACKNTVQEAVNTVESQTQTESTQETNSSDTQNTSSAETASVDNQSEDTASESATGGIQSQDAGTPMEMRDISSVDLVKEIKIGWNLGNTLDATGGSALGSETSWGNPKTTKEMIDAVKAAGFNTIRIPTTWQNHLGTAPDYKIDEAWLNRVQEVVDYAIANDMYVILNAHHEDWHFPSYDNLDAAKNELTKLWEQVAAHFQNYDEHLIFEGMNEPRMKGTDLEWTGGNEEAHDVINQLNAAFIETIRNAGGNNPLRHLMIPTYAASTLPKVLADFIVPKDDKVIVSVHSYSPYNFALNRTGTSSWKADNSADTSEIDYLMNAINSTFLSKGIPVILGEFGASDKENLADRVAWGEYYIKAATKYGISCIWWDNGAFSGDGENFGLLDRRTLSWKYPELLDALMNGLNK